MTQPRLLVVEDEAPLLDLLRRYLERLGYQVHTAASASEALSVFAKEPLQYRLVITDLSLDGMNGEELVVKMREQNPDLPGLVSSGYPYQPKARRIGFLQKPYLPNMLADSIKKLLN